jgi:hypothetical protein
MKAKNIIYSDDLLHLVHQQGAITIWKMTESVRNRNLHQNVDTGDIQAQSNMVQHWSQ